MGMATLLRRFPMFCGSSATHLSVAIGSSMDNRRYCTKDDTRVLGPWEFGEIPSVGRPTSKHTLDEAVAALEEAKYDLDVLARSQPVLFGKFHRQLEAITARCQPKPVVDFSQPREWQSKVVDLIKTQADSRSVNWFVDLEGSQGKTYLSKHLIAEYDAFYCTGGRHLDVCHAYNNQNIIIFDFTREKEDHICYSTIETLKNGLVFSSKYNSTTKVRPHNAHILIFANFEPDQSKLSQDRWRITRLTTTPAVDPVPLALLGI